MIGGCGRFLGPEVIQCLSPAMDSSTKTNSAEEIIKTGDQKQAENTPLKQLRFSHLQQKRAEIKAGMEY